MVLDRRLLFVLQRAARSAVARTNSRLAEQLEISVAQLGTLSFIFEHPDCAPSQIADLFDLNKSGVTTMLRRLERAGMIKRTANPQDGRGVLLRITRKGNEVRQASRPVFSSSMSDITAGFTKGEMEIVLRFLNTVIDRCGTE